MTAPRRHAALLGSTALAALGLAAATPQAARAQLYTNRANFNSALLPGSYTEPFNSGSGLAKPSYSFSGNGYNYTATATGPGDDTVYRGSGIISTNTSPDSLVFTFTSGNVTAVGGDFFATDISNNIVPSTVTLTLGNGLTTTFTTDSANTFRGYVSAVPILSLTESVSAGTYATADNLTVGTNAAIPAPEPSSVAAFAFTALGAATLMLRARKRSLAV